MALAQLDQHQALVCRSLHQSQLVSEACRCTSAGQPLRLWAVPAGIPGILRVFTAKGIDSGGRQGGEGSRLVDKIACPAV